jgi:hypothetical protein
MAALPLLEMVDAPRSSAPTLYPLSEMNDAVPFEDLMMDTQNRIRQEADSINARRQSDPRVLGPRYLMERLIHTFPEEERASALYNLAQLQIECASLEGRIPDLDEYLEIFGTDDGEVITRAFLELPVEQLETDLEEGNKPQFRQLLELVPAAHQPEVLCRCVARIKKLPEPARRGRLLSDLWSELQEDPNLAALFATTLGHPEPGASIGPSVEVAPAKVEPRYKLSAIIGFSGEGVVYAARDRKWGRKQKMSVALKLLRRDYWSREEFAQIQNHLKEEALLTKKLEGIPNVVVVHEFFEQDDFVFFTMLLVPGGKTVRSRIAQRGRLPAREAAQLGIQLATTLERIHQRGIVHLDVKPANLLRTPRGEIVLCDFGHALKMDSRRQAETSSARGTPGYMAPEQLRRGIVDGRTDVFGIGATLVRTLTGAVPFPEQRHPGTEAKRPRFRDWRLAAVCAKCTREDPDQRYQTAAELCDDLKLYLAGGPVTAQPFFAFRSPLWKCRWALRAVAVVAVLLYASWVVGGWLQKEVPGCEASQGWYRNRHVVAPPELQLVPLEAIWPNPDYSGFRFVMTSMFWDLSDWRPVPPGAAPEKAGRVEPAHVTRIVRVYRKPSAKDNSVISFQYRTEGSEVDMTCKSHLYTVKGATNRGELGGLTKKLLLIRQIDVDLSQEPYDKEIQIVLHYTIWNGFQVRADGKQWVGALAPDEIPMMEMAILFPAKHMPAGLPQLTWFPRGKEEEFHLDSTTPPIFFPGVSPRGQHWWVWRPLDVHKDHVYKITWDWAPTTNP